VGCNPIGEGLNLASTIETCLLILPDQPVYTKLFFHLTIYHMGPSKCCRSHFPNMGGGFPGYLAAILLSRCRKSDLTSSSILMIYCAVGQYLEYFGVLHNFQKNVFLNMIIWRDFVLHFRFCYVIFNSHMFNAPRFNSEKDVSLQNFLL
jgi:hypothetical protein